MQKKVWDKVNQKQINLKLLEEFQNVKNEQQSQVILDLVKNNPNITKKKRLFDNPKIQNPVSVQRNKIFANGLKKLRIQELEISTNPKCEEGNQVRSSSNNFRNSLLKEKHILNKEALKKIKMAKQQHEQQKLCSLNYEDHVIDKYTPLRQLSGQSNNKINNSLSSPKNLSSDKTNLVSINPKPQLLEIDKPQIVGTSQKSINSPLGLNPHTFSLAQLKRAPKKPTQKLKKICTSSQLNSKRMFNSKAH